MLTLGTGRMESETTLTPGDRRIRVGTPRSPRGRGGTESETRSSWEWGKGGGCPLPGLSDAFVDRQVGSPVCRSPEAAGLPSRSALH